MIKIICIGKIKEKYLIDALEDYKKRLSKYTKLEIIELKDEPGEKCLLLEKESIKKNIKSTDIFDLGIIVQTLNDGRKRKIDVYQLKLELYNKEGEMLYARFNKGNGTLCTRKQCSNYPKRINCIYYEVY